MKYALSVVASGLFLAGCVTVQSTETSAAPAPQAVQAERPSTNLVILYNLKDGVTPADFREWVMKSDYPAMRGLERVEAFHTHKAVGLLPGTGDGEPSVDYVETFAIPDLDGFVAEDMPGETVQTIMSEFTGFAEAPEFIVVREIE